MTTKKTEPQLPEAPASLNFHATTRKGWNMQLTLRDSDEFVLMERFKVFVEKLEEWHVTPKGGAKSNNFTGGAYIPTKPEPAPANVSPPPAKETTTETGWIDAEVLTGSTSGDRVYWKVKGGVYSKFGVTVWPEVLETAGFGDHLDPLQDYDITGYRATYTMEDGKPKKVIKLEKV